MYRKFKRESWEFFWRIGGMLFKNNFNKIKYKLDSIMKINCRKNVWDNFWYIVRGSKIEVRNLRKYRVFRNKIRWNNSISCGGNSSCVINRRGRKFSK